MARDPKRIPEILEALRKAWELYPDLRLGQLVMNAAPIHRDVFMLEDDEMLTFLQSYSKKIKAFHAGTSDNPVVG